MKNKITENGECTNSCYLTEYKYEYNFRCYSNCLTGTYNNNYKCEKCHEDCEICDGPYTIQNSNCLSCVNKNKYLYFGNCIDECPKYYFYNDTINQNICDCELTKCKTCSRESLNNNLCTSCDNEEGYYPKYDDLNINNLDYYDCYKSPEGYYLDNEILIYKLCYQSCKKCDKSGSETEHNCLECKSGYNFEIIFDAYKNCYDTCLYHRYYSENDNKIYCTINMECPINYNKLIEDKKECISDCSKDNQYKYEFKNKCYTECPFNSIIREKDEDLSQFFLDKNIFCKPICNESNPFEIIYLQECVEYCEIKQLKNKSCILNFHHLNSEENKTKKIYDNYLINIESELTSGTYEISDLENWDDDIIHLDKATITLTTVKNQKDNKNDIYSSNVDLKDCEDILKQTYHIPDNEVLFMKKIDFIEDGMKISKINYEVYTKFNRSNLLKLNLSYCKETKIDILIPYQLTENVDILNSSSKY